MGLEEYLGGDGVAVVEWPGQCPEAIPGTALIVEITPLDDNTRDIRLAPTGDFRKLDWKECGL